MAGKFSHDIIFVEFIDFKGEIWLNGVQYWFKNLGKKALWFPFLTHLKIALSKPDIVVVHGLLYPHQIIFLKFFLSSKVKIIVQHHAEKPSLNRVKLQLQKLADSLIDRYFFTSLGLAGNWISGGVIKNEEKIKEVMEVSSVFHEIDKTVAKAITNVDAENSFLWVGRLNENKNPMLVLKAFAAFVKKRKDVKLFMIFHNEDLLPQIREFLSDNSFLSEYISLVGKCDHPQLLYWFNSVDYIISSSYYEAGGVSVCEAMSCGCIPILSDIPAFRFVTNSTCGILYETGNSDALLNALMKSVDMNKEQEKQRTLVQYQNHLSFNAIAGSINKIIQTL